MVQLNYLVDPKCNISYTSIIHPVRRQQYCHRKRL